MDGQVLPGTPARVPGANVFALRPDWRSGGVWLGSSEEGAGQGHGVGFRLIFWLVQANAPLSRMPQHRAGTTWLPYTLIDAVVETARTHKAISPETHNQLGELQRELQLRVKQLQKLSSSN